MGILIAGLGLAEESVEMVSIFDHHHDKTDDEAIDVDRGTGEAATVMVVQHLITAVYGHFELGVIALGAVVFRFWLTSYEDEFTCDLQEGTITPATYANAFPIISQWKDRATCRESIDQMFEIEDINNDGFITRCEDAILQYNFGATKEYAFKFSAQFSKDQFRKICEENFPY